MDVLLFLIYKKGYTTAHILKFKDTLIYLFKYVHYIYIYIYICKEEKLRNLL